MKQFLHVMKVLLVYSSKVIHRWFIWELQRRRRDVLMDVVDTYHWDVLVTYHWDVVGCFIWDLFETSWRRTDGTSSLCPLETSSQHTNKMSWKRTTETSWRCSTETLLGVSFETYLWHHWDVQRDVVTTSPRRLVDRLDCMCVCVKTKRIIAGNVFSQSGTEIMRTYPIRKHLWNIMKF